MEIDPLDIELKIPVTIDQSIFADKQNFKTLREIDTWAVASINQMGSSLPGAKKYLDEGQIDALGEPFRQINEIVKEIQSSKKPPTSRKIQSKSKEIQSLIDNTIGKGLTFAHPSEISTDYRKNGNEQYTVGLLLGLFGFKVTANSNQVYSLTSHQHYDHGRNLAQMLIGKNQNVTNNAQLNAEQIQIAKIAANWSQLRDEAKAVLANIETEFEDLKAVRNSTSEKYTDEFSKRLRRYVVLFRKHSNRKVEIENAFQRNVDVHKAEMEKIRQAFQAETSMKDTAKYWSSRANRSGIFAIVAGIVFSGLSIGGIFYSFTKGPKLYSEMIVAAGDKDLSLVSLAIFTFPVIVFLWILKAVSRIFVENLHIHQTAKYKQMLVNTYLSMLKDEVSPITPEERQFALNAIFTADPGKASPMTIPIENLKNLTKPE